MAAAERTATHDAIILGGGLAGLSLARQLLLYSDCRVTLIEKKAEIPGSRQKVGESLVQLGGYYFSRLLQLEQHLLERHYLKYNLRFHWTADGRANDGIEDYSSCFIGKQSDIATFQLDRNVLEEHLLELNQADPRFSCTTGVKGLEVDLAEQGPHRVRWQGGEARARWVVDAGGRASILRRKLKLKRDSPIQHGSTWCWVDGLVDIEQLTRRTASERRLDPRRRVTGHFPQYLSTNHFCGESQWFWVIPLHGRTSLGLVYDRAVVDPDEVSSARKMLDHVCRQWPLFAKDLPNRKIIDKGAFLNFSYDSNSAIDPAGWALSGESARFSDPLYSPGSDLIAIHNTLIVDCIQRNGENIDERCRLYDLLMRVMHDAYVPSYVVSYNCLGDQQTFTLKYSWELAIYFGFYVLPFINDMFTDERFVRQFLRRFAILGPINERLQHFLSSYYQWKKENGVTQSEPLLKDLYDVTPLYESGRLFWEVGLSRNEAIDALDLHVERLKEFARFIVAHVAASVSGNPGLVHDKRFVSGLKLRSLEFDAEELRRAGMLARPKRDPYPWRLDASSLDLFLANDQALADAV